MLILAGEVEVESAAVTNKAWPPRKAFFVGWRRAGLLIGIKTSLITKERGTRDHSREKYLSFFGLLVISPCGAFLAFPSHPAPTISNLPRGAKAKEAKVGPERAAVSNMTWSVRKAFFVG